MDKIKVTAHTSYTYETADGTEFNNKQEAEAWQHTLDVLKNTLMLDREFNPTEEPYFTAYLVIKNQEQLEAFNASADFNGTIRVPGIGYYYYDYDLDCYINIKIELDKLQDMVDKLDSQEA